MYHVGVEHNLHASSVVIVVAAIGRWSKQRGLISRFYRKISQPAIIAVEQSPSGKMAIDVYGQQIEPICNYRTCNHKFSSHGHSGSKCL